MLKFYVRLFILLLILCSEAFASSIILEAKELKGQIIIKIYHAPNLKFSLKQSDKNLTFTANNKLEYFSLASANKFRKIASTPMLNGNKITLSLFKPTTFSKSTKQSKSTSFSFDITDESQAKELDEMLKSITKESPKPVDQSPQIDEVKNANINIDVKLLSHDFSLINFIKQGKNGHFLQVRMELENLAIKDSYKALLELAKFYFNQSFYNESVGYSEILAKDFTSLFQLDKNLEIFYAINLTITNRLSLASKLYNDLIIKYPNIELMIWYNYNKYLMNEELQNLAVFDNIKIIESYPEDLYWKLVFAEMDLLLKNNDLNNFAILVTKIRTAKNVTDFNSTNYYKALYNIKRQNLKDANNLLQQILSQNELLDPLNYYRAKLALLAMLYNNKTIDDLKYLKELDEISLIWRGDQYEYNFLFTKFQIYKKLGQNIEALRTLKYIINNINVPFDRFYISGEIAKIYDQIFPEEFNKLDDFHAVALFNEFIDIMPIDKDNIVSLAANKMINLDLLDMAEEILEHQVIYRLKRDSKIETSNKLAALLIQNNKPQKAIDILDMTDVDNYSFENYQHRLRLKAKALIRLANFDKALKLIKDDDSEDSLSLKKDLYFESENWTSYVKIMEPKIAKYTLEQELNQDEQGDLIKLFISYSMLDQNNKIADLDKKLSSKNINAKNTAKFLLASTKSKEYKSLLEHDKIQNIDEFINNYINTILQQ